MSHYDGWMKFANEFPDLKESLHEVEFVYRCSNDLWDMPADEGSKALAERARKYLDREQKPAKAETQVVENIVGGAYDKHEYQDSDESEPTEYAAETIRRRRQARLDASRKLKYEKVS